MKKSIILLVTLSLLSLTLLYGCAFEPLEKSNVTDIISQSTESYGTAETTAIPETTDQTPSQEDDQEPPAEEIKKDAYLNGIKLSEYSIVYGANDTDYAKRAAVYIHTKIQERTNLNLNLITDKNLPTSHEIVVGETSRGISKKLDKNLSGVSFALLADSGSVALEGEFFVIAAAAYFFIDTYVTENFFDSTVPTQTTVFEPITKKANNYILLIGDGMGVYQTKLFDSMNASTAVDYSDGEDIFYGYMLKANGFARTNSLSGTTDSAAAGTALATGYKTTNERIGQDKDAKDIQSLTELAASLGKSTAVMSTDLATGATPSAFSAHTNDRDNTSEIESDQTYIKNKYGTIIDCNYNEYSSAGVKAIENRVNSMLTKLSKSENGFFMMYEEAHIDKHCHSKDMNATFRAVIRFNQIIGTVMEYAFYNPDTFILITADHETGSLLPNSSGGFTYGSGNHSSQYVPVFAHGYGAELFDGVTVENTQIPKTIASFLGVLNFGDQTDEYPPLI